MKRILQLLIAIFWPRPRVTILFVIGVTALALAYLVLFDDSTLVRFGVLIPTVVIQAAIVEILSFTGFRRKLLNRIMKSIADLSHISFRNVQRFSSEAAKLALEGMTGTVVAIFMFSTLTIVGYASESGLFFDARHFSCLLLVAVVGYRVTLILRVVTGRFGLNEFEAIEFFTWLVEKSKNGNDDFGGKAVEDLKEKLVLDLSEHTRGKPA